MKTKHEGFTAVEGLLILVIVGLVGFTGWYVYQSRNKTNASYNSANTVSNSPIPKAKKPVPTSSTGTSAQATYLVIKEWGLRIKLTTPISDAYYKVMNYDSTGKIVEQIDLSLLSLANTQCKAGGWPPAGYFRYTSSDTDPVSGKPYTELDGTSHKIGSYYYAYSEGVGASKTYGCQSTPENQIKANEAAKAFEAALDTLQPVPQ